MTPRRRTRVAGLIACGLFASLAADCPYLENLPFFGAAAGTRAILLRIVNESGVDVLFEAAFFDGDNEIRNTTRRLAVQGPQATDLVVPTATTRIHITVRQDQPPLLNALPGDFLADEDIFIDLAALAGDTVTYVIHPFGWVDCNQNGIDDGDELTAGDVSDCNHNNVPDTCDLAGASTDCNGNAVPDECDIADQSSTDCNANSIPDECDLASGLSQDCNLNLILDECDPIVPVVLVIAEPHKIYQSDQDGTTPSVLIDLSNYALGTLRKIDLDRGGSRLFFTEAVSISDGTVQVMPLGGGTPTQLIGTQENISGIGLNPGGGKMYWVATDLSSGHTVIREANLDGSGTVVDVVTGLLGQVAKPAVDPLNGRLYFTFTAWVGPHAILRANLDGSAQQTVIPSAVSPSDVELWPEGDTLFWTEQGAGRGLYRARLDGSGPLLIAGGSTFTGLAFDLDNCKVYWTAIGGGGIKDGLVECADIDGTNRRTVLTGLDNPQDIALYH